MMNPSIHRGDDDLEILPKEGSISTCESKWCVFCGNGSRNERKRNTCDTYEGCQSPIKMSKTFRKVMKKYGPTLLPQNILAVLNARSVILRLVFLA